MSGLNILLIEDEEEVREYIKLILENEGYEVMPASSAEEGLDMLKSYLPDLIILDLVLPGIQGLEACKIIKQNPTCSSIPLIILTSKDAEDDVVNGLESGSDDYVVKSLSNKILISRIKAIFRRKPRTTTITNSSQEDTSIKLDKLYIDAKRYKAFIESKPVNLSISEFKILHFLAERPGWVYTRSQIIESIKKEDNIINDRTIDVLIAGLRKKLDIYGESIRTIRGVGYCFDCE